MDSSDERKKILTGTAIAAAVTLGIISLAATALLYGRLPREIPLRWGLNGEITQYGPRYMAWVLGSLPLAVAGLMTLLPKIDPRRRNYRLSSRAYTAVLMGITAVLLFFQLVMLTSSIGIPLRVDSAVKAGVGALFILIGNYLGTVRSTFFFGIRTPWTLSSDTVWRRTHRLGGRLFMVAGLVFILAAFFRGLPSLVLPLGAIAVAVVVPVVYSYLLYRKEQQET